MHSPNIIRVQLPTQTQFKSHVLSITITKRNRMKASSYFPKVIVGLQRFERTILPADTEKQKRQRVLRKEKGKKQKERKQDNPEQKKINVESGNNYTFICLFLLSLLLLVRTGSNCLSWFFTFGSSLYLFSSTKHLN